MLFDEGYRSLGCCIVRGVVSRRRDRDPLLCGIYVHIKNSAISMRLSMLLHPNHQSKNDESSKPENPVSVFARTYAKLNDW